MPGRNLRRPILFVIALVAFTLTGCTPRKPPVTARSVQPPALTVARCHIHGGLPDPSPACTPGAVRTTDVSVICHGGSTRQYRPSSSYTYALKRQQIIAYGYVDTAPGHYEEDHLVPLELGGDGRDPKNLWPEPHAGKNNSFDKDKVENYLHRQVCSGTMTAQAAQRGIASDWRQYLTRASRAAMKTEGRVE
jgi:hypothetical protein